MPDSESAFELHPRLRADTHLLGKFPLSMLLLMNDAHYPWFILVPRRAGVSEIYQLTSDDQVQLVHESSALARGLADCFAPDKINIAALGNVVAQLHLHHIVRYSHDPAWPAPVWGRVPPRAYTDGELTALRAKVLACLGADFAAAG